MSIRIIPDEDKPSAAIEIVLEKPLPDYDLEQMEQPTPRDVDGILVTQGFRDLVDDTRGILIELISKQTYQPGLDADDTQMAPLSLTSHDPIHLEIVQITGAICPGDGVYRPGLWIVMREPRMDANAPLPTIVLGRIETIAHALAKRLDLE